jgi:hypothetical protein
MAITFRPYNHTASRYFSGANAIGDTYKVNLYSVLPFIPAATTKAAAEVGATQLPTANGYTQNSKVIEGLVATIIATNGCKLDGEDVIWTASGGELSAIAGLVFNDTDADDPPAWHISFGNFPLVAGDGDQFLIQWNSLGLATVGTN